MKEELISKALSPTDLSKSVLKSGRIVLPRTLMERNVERVITYGGTSSTLSRQLASNPQFSVDLVLFLDLGTSETPEKVIMTLKKWTSSTGGRPIYVLEKTAECMAQLKAHPGDCMLISGLNGALYLSLIKSKSARATGTVGTKIQKPRALDTQHTHQQQRSRRHIRDTTDQEMNFAGETLLSLRNGSSTPPSTSSPPPGSSAAQNATPHPQEIEVVTGISPIMSSRVPSVASLQRPLPLACSPEAGDEIVSNLYQQHNLLHLIQPQQPYSNRNQQYFEQQIPQHAQQEYLGQQASSSVGTDVNFKIAEFLNFAAQYPMLWNTPDISGHEVDTPAVVATGNPAPAVHPPLFHRAVYQH